MKILLDRIKDSPRPIRTSWDEDALNELARSIAEQGVIVPIKVRMPDLAQHCWTMRDHGLTCIDAEQDRLDRVGNEDWGTCVPYCPWCQAVEWEEHEEDEDDPIPADWKPYEIVYGHRRVEAARRANLTEIEAIVEGLEDKPTDIQAVIENVQRADLSEKEEGDAYNGLAQRYGMTPQEIAAATGVSLYRVRVRMAFAKDAVSAIGGPKSAGDLSRKASVLRGAFGDDVELRREAWDYVLPREEKDMRAPFQAISAIGDRDTQRALIAKAKDEDLGAESLRNVAETIARTTNPERRKALLETPYNQFVHNPEYAEANEQMARAAAPSPGEEFDRLPAIAVGLEAMKEFRKTMTLMLEACKVGKASPEARRFFARRIDGMIQFLTSIKEGLAE
jgi:ParB-like chromosome segregation protein Spo0J